MVLKASSIIGEMNKRLEISVSLDILASRRLIG
jgi:hypothetical protein